ncbi:MAG: hypothetical protein K0U78_08880 [Actinomycetia bacterium]|nr:hypothetical protein [Actinomycetes bacterium]
MESASITTSSASGEAVAAAVAMFAVRAAAPVATVASEVEPLGGRVDDSNPSKTAFCSGVAGAAGVTLAAEDACSASIGTVLIEELGGSATEFIAFGGSAGSVALGGSAGSVALGGSARSVTLDDSTGAITLLLGVYDDAEVCAEEYELGESSVGAEVSIPP